MKSSKEDCVAAARKYKEKIRQRKAPLLEVRRGDMVIHSLGGLTMLVLRVTTDTETLKPVVEYAVQAQPHEGTKTITYDKLRRMHRLGKYIIYKGSSWNE